MKTPYPSRRTFLTASAAAAAVTWTSPSSKAETSIHKPEDLVSQFDEAWAQHDAHSLAMLHTEDVIVVNRYGPMLEGRVELEKALGFLHGPSGPFHKVTFPRQKILTTRMIGTSIAAIHTKWSNPEMATGDQLRDGGPEMRWVDMIATYLLVNDAGEWRLAQNDLHNVDSIQFPVFDKVEQING